MGWVIALLVLLLLVIIGTAVWLLAVLDHISNQLAQVAAVLVEMHTTQAIERPGIADAQKQIRRLHDQLTPRESEPWRY